MAVWTLVLLLAACGAISASANSVEFIEGPVLLPSCSASQTVVRCSIEVDGIVTPRIDFYINGELSRNYGYLSCNSEDVPRYVLENDSVPKTCTVNDTAGETKRRVHQTMFIRTCPSDSSSFGSVIIQCIVHSNMYPAVNGTASSRMNLTYNERQKPLLYPVGNEPVIYISDPVCPGEDFGRFSLESQSSPFPSRCTTSASPIIETPSTTSPLGAQTSVTPTPSSSSPPPLTTSSGPLTEGQLMLIIYIATGVAAFFALLVVCLIFMLCCIVTKKHRMQKASPLRQGRRDVAHGPSFGLTDNDKVNNRDRGSSSPESAAHQLDLHRGSDSSQSGSIRSSNGDEERSHVRTSVEVRDGHPLVERDVPSSIPNPLSLHREEAEAALQEHDYDSIDDDWPVPNRREGEVWKGAVRVDTKGRKKNTYVAEYESQPLHLSVSDTASDRSGPFPTTEFGVSSMEQNMLYPTSELPGTNTPSDPPRKQQDYVNRPAHDYVNDGQQSHDYTNDEHLTGAVYHNSLMFGAEIHDYRNHPQPGSKVQMLMKMDPMTDSYQELNTVGSTSSMTGDPCAQYTASSHLETFPLDLQRLGSENVYHTLCPSDGDSASSSSSEYSLPRNGAPAAAKSATVGAPVYDRLQALNSGRDTHVPTRKTSAPSARRDSEYTDLETVNMEQSSDYSTLNSTETVNIGTQTYDTSTA